MKLGDLFVKLGLKSDEFNSGIKKAQGGLGGFKNAIKSIGPMIAAAFSVRAIANFAKESIALANVQIKAENELAAAIAANGKEVEGTLRRYKSFASGMQQVTTIGDETTLSMLRLAESLQSRAPEEAAKMAIGLSKALGMDLQTATRAAVLAQEGNYIALSRYIPALRTATSETEKAAAVQKLIASGMQIATAETKTAAGQVQQLKNAWGDLKEELGRVIVENDGLINSIGKLKTQVELLPQYAKLWQRSMQFIFGSSVRRQIKQQEKDFDDFVQSIVDGLKETNEETEKGNRVNEEKIKTIADLRQEIKDLEEGLESYGLTQRGEIQRDLASIESKKELLKTILELNKARKIQRQIDAIDFRKTPITGNLVAREGFLGIKRPAFMQDMPPLDTKQLDDLTGFMAEKRRKVAEMQKEMELDWAGFNQNLQNLVQDFSIDVVEQFGSAIGELLATGKFPGDFGKGLLDSIGRFMSTLGKMLIALGTASEGFQALLGSGFTSPAAALAVIGAGAALVALGGAVSSYARSRAGGGAGASAPGMFNQQYNVNPAFAAAGGGQGSLFLRGDDLYISGQRNDFKRGQIG